MKQYWDLLEKHIQPQRGRFILLAVLMFGSIGLQVINPQIMRTFIDTALAGGALNTLTLAAVAFIGIALVQQGVAVGVTYLGENVAWTATNALRAELARHCLNLDMSFHNKHTPGELIERIDGDVTEMATFFSQFAVMLVGNLLLMTGVLIALYLEDWRAGLAFTVFSILSLLALNKVRNLAMAHEKARRQAEADLFGFVEEQLNGTEDVRSSGAVDFSLRELVRLQSEILRHDRKARMKEWVIHNTTGLVLTGGTILSVVTGYLLYRSGSITIGTVYLFIHYMTLLEAPIWALTHEMSSFQKIGACVERLTELRAETNKVVESPDAPKTPLVDGPLSVAFENVSFGYNHDEPVLKTLNFRLEPGTVLGLLGRTGSGKTTLTRLVFRLYDPTAGRITLDGARDLREVEMEALRRRVAMVTQEVQLFQATVRDNLTFFDPEITDAKIEEAINALELGDWYRSLPKGSTLR